MPTTIFTNALGTNRADTQVSFRNVVPITGGAQTQVRVTFTAGLATFILNNASIGISSGTTMITTATPVELLFGGVSGFTILSGATITSDWVNLSGFTASDKLVVVMDYSVAGGSSSTDQSGGAGADLWYLFGAFASYNSADPTALGSWNSIAWVLAVSLIETQSVGGGGRTAIILPGPQGPMVI